MIILVALFVLLIIGTSYALWQMTFRQEGTNQVNTDCFKVEFFDKNPITLGEAYPIADTDGGKLAPYEFSITNICSENVRFEVNLEILDETTLGNLSYIKTMYNENDPKILTEYESIEPTLSNAVDSYNLEVGYLEINEKKTFNLRLWLSVDTPLNEDTMNKTLSSKVTVTTSYAKKLPGTLRRVTDSESSGMWEYKKNITKLVIQNKLNKINGAVKVSDESETKDESIMSYVVPNTDGTTYVAYLQSNGKLILNPDSSYLFRSFINVKEIEGMEHLDTSNVINMNFMFSLCRDLTSLDLSHFNTGNVTSMFSMFDGCWSLTSLDLSSFDTSNVTNMLTMFRQCSSLTSIDVSNFDTTKVTDMRGMFSICSSLTLLDLSSFNTRNVEYMGKYYTSDHAMFEDCVKLTSINYGVNFIRKSNSNIKSMFDNCPANKPTDSSWNGATF